MPFATARDGTSLYFQDWGSGPAVVLSHGWPLNADMWEYQALALADAGFRVIAHDRRGFGRSGKPWVGHDYDTFADDLAAVLDTAEVRAATLVGFSMGGGEVARYLTRHGTGRVAKAVLLAAVTPFLLHTPDNPHGAPKAVFDGMVGGILADRAGFFAGFGPGFYGPPTVSDGIGSWTLGMALAASLKGTIDCVRAFSETDFRPDMPAFTVPTLVIHGDSDAVVPIDLTARAAAVAIPGARLEVYAGAGHGLFFTHKDRLNADLIGFARG